MANKPYTTPQMDVAVLPADDMMASSAEIKPGGGGIVLPDDDF